jgi:hypothetical protein
MIDVGKCTFCNGSTHALDEGTFIDPVFIARARQRNLRYVDVWANRSNVRVLLGGCAACYTRDTPQISQVASGREVIDINLAMLRAGDYSRDYSRERASLLVRADALQFNGDPLGIYIVDWLMGEGLEAPAAAAALEALTDRLVFEKRGGIVWAPRKTKDGDWLDVDGRAYVVEGSHWVDRENKRKQVRVRPSGKAKLRKSAAGLPKGERTKDQTPQDRAGLSPYSGAGYQGDQLAARQASARARGEPLYPGTDD